MISRQRSAARRGLAVLAFLLVLVAGGAAGDDRELLRARGSEPYVFFLMDTSSSMTASPICSALDACEDIDPYDRACTRLCTTGNAFDPNDPFCSQQCPDWGCVQFGEADAAPRLDFQFDDATDAMVFGGGWSPSSPSGAFGGNAQVAVEDTSAPMTQFATFTIPNVFTDTRRHKVSIHVPRSDQWSDEVMVQVIGTNDDETVVVNQRTPAAQAGVPEETYNPWFLVGVYEIPTGASVQVRIFLEGTFPDPVVVDGVRFLSEVKVCERMGYRCQTPLCPEGDCFLTANADDPGSKFFQAKQAVYETLEQVSNVRLGFATFEQDRLQIYGKHWLYRVREFKPDNVTPQDFLTLPATGAPYPTPGTTEVFGVVKSETQSGGAGPGLWDCAPPGSSAMDNARRIGCEQGFPALLTDDWERQRLRHIPKLGENKNIQTVLFATPDNRADLTQLTRITYEVGGNAYGSPILAVTIKVERCNPLSGRFCFDSRFIEDQVATIYYDLVTDFVGYGRQSGTLPGQPFPPPFFNPFGFLEDQDSRNDAACGNPTPGGDFGPYTGWDPNDDDGDNLMPNFEQPAGGDNTVDKAVNVNLRWPTVSDPRSNATNKGVFDEGDVIPWDWTSGQDHLDEIKWRMAPNTIVPGNTDPPDFRVATYFRNTVDPADFTAFPNRQLRLVDEDQRPLIPAGTTPLGRSMRNFLEWHGFFKDDAEVQSGPGDLAFDPDWECRDRFLVLLTDGDESCKTPDPDDPDACVEATDLLSAEVKTFAIGFGLKPEQATNKLACIAQNGGTGQPILPRNKEELANALLDIFADVETSARTFSAAAMPTTQSAAADKIFFSSFTPLPGQPYWPSRIDVFRAPILAETQPTDCGRRCRLDNLESSCHLWNAGDTILAQAPLASQLATDPPDGNVGPTAGQRRVLYPPPFRPAKPDGTIAQPVPLRLFQLPDLNMPASAEFEDWREVFVRPAEQRTLADSAIAIQFKDIYRGVLGVKNSPEIANQCGDGRPPEGVGPAWAPGDYLLGDVFHAAPLVPPGASDLRLLRNDQCSTLNPTAPNNCAPFGVGDGAEAAERSYRNFVARSVWYRRMLTAASNDGQLHFFDLGRRREINNQEVFDDGTGIELFSFMPRMVMPIVREQALGSRHIFSVDGPVTVGDVVVDPVFATDPSPADREWRTVLIGGLREGGDRFDDLREVSGFVGGYYALDITQPDGLIVDDPANTPTDIFDDQYRPDDRIASGLLPSCLKLSGDLLVPDGTAACASPADADVPFPALKWEFTDRLYFEDTNLANGDSSGWFLLDEDRNGEHDLGGTWSKPLIAQVRLIGGETRWVAIFGGGLDPSDKLGTRRGNWLYMIDIETGTILYKRQVEGAVPADVTGFDEDRDGLLDLLYFVTTAGFLYKIDLRQPAALVADTVETDQLLGWPGSNAISVMRIDPGFWQPFKIFDTEGKPLYFPPAVFFIPQTEQLGLAFGTGDREDLWSEEGIGGRFYVIVDQDFSASTVTPVLPLVEDVFFNLDFDSPLVGGIAPNFLLVPGMNAEPGWVMRFPLNARISSRAFVLTGVLVFTSFQPDRVPLAQAGQALCLRGGVSQTFLVDVRNGNALTTLADLGAANPDPNRPLEGGTTGMHNPPSGSNPPIGGSCGDRCIEKEGLGAAPFVTTIGTPNPTGDSTDDPLANAVMKRLLENMKETFFPPGCKFNDSFVKMIRMQFDDTGVQNLVPVPVGLCPSDAIVGLPVWSEE